MNASILASLQLQYPMVPSINSNLNLKMVGLSSLDGLSEFTGVKCLDASNNSLDCVVPAHVSFMTDLRILKLQHNKIIHFPSFASNSLLHTLDLSCNMISIVCNLSLMPSLRSLHLSGNRLATTESLSDICSCPLLETLELNANQIDGCEVLPLLSTLPSLRWLQMRGNPVVALLSPYRKTVVGTITQLVALDGEAIEDRERFFAAAFVVGGSEAEHQARDAYILKIKEREKRNREFLRSQRSSRSTPAPSRPHVTLNHFHGVTPMILQASEALCGICMQALSGDCASLSCQHHFHQQCILQWLSCSLHCPSCRASVIAIDHNQLAVHDTAELVCDRPVVAPAPAAQVTDDAAAVRSAKRLLIQQKVEERRKQIAMERIQQSIDQRESFLGSIMLEESTTISQTTVSNAPNQHAANESPDAAGQDAAANDEAPAPVSSPVLRGRGRGKLVQPIRSSVAADSGCASDAVDGGHEAGASSSVPGVDGDRSQDDGTSSMHLAGMQQAHQADSSRQQRTLAALGKKLAKGEALLKGDVAAMLEKQGGDASATAVSSEVTRRRQAWEAEFQQFCAERQQGCVAREGGASVERSSDSGVPSAANESRDAAGQDAAANDEAPVSSPAADGEGKCSPQRGSDVVAFPVLLQSNSARSEVLTPGFLLRFMCSVTVGPSRCSSTLVACSCTLGRVFDASVCCVDAVSKIFRIRFSFHRVSGTLSVSSSSFPQVFPVGPGDDILLSAANLPCSLSVVSCDGVVSVCVNISR
jgi:hypothetical protein